MSSTSQQHKNSVVEIELLTLFFFNNKFKKIGKKKKESQQLREWFWKDRTQNLPEIDITFGISFTFSG